MHIDIDVIKEILLSLSEKRKFILPSASERLKAFNADLLDRHSFIKAVVHTDPDHGDKQPDSALLIEIYPKGKELLGALSNTETFTSLRSILSENKEISSFSVFMSLIDKVRNGL